MCADMVDLRWVDEKDRPQHTTALLEDISACGACLQLEIALPLGTEVRWQCPKQSFAGFVRYCVYQEIGYFVGVEFSEDCRWSKKSYRPLHLLDLEKLAARSKKRKKMSSASA